MSVILKRVDLNDVKGVAPVFVKLQCSTCERETYFTLTEYLQQNIEMLALRLDLESQNHRH